MLLAFLAGCSGSRKSGGGGDAVENPRGESAGGSTPAFALPGVPLKSEMQAAPAAEKSPEAAALPPAEVKPAEANTAEPKPAEARPAEAAAAAGGDLEFHLRAARKYSAAKRYRSAAAEYGAAAGFLPAGDARAVNLLERQGAMMLRAGDEHKAQARFTAAIETAKELNISGKDLADAYLGLGYCLEKANKIPEAISNYEKARVLSASKTIKARISKTISDLKKTP